MTVIQFNFSIYLKYIFVLLYPYVWGLECMHVHHGHAEVRRGHQTPDTGVVDNCELLHESWKLNLGLQPLPLPSLLAKKP